MGDLIDRDKLLDNLPKNDTVLSLDVRRIVVEAPAVDAVPMTHDLDSSDLIRRKDVLWITKETGAWETQNRVRELPAVDAVPVAHGEWIGEANGYADGELVYDVWYCPHCNYCIDNGTDNPALLPKYCPDCGIKLDAPKEEIE